MKRPQPMPLPGDTDNVRLVDAQVLSNNWYTLRKISVELRRRDGQWQRLSREAYDRGNGAALLLWDPRRSTVVLTRQFRLPAFLNGSPDGQLIEACAGLLDGDEPEACIRREAEEETGYRIRTPRKLFEAYMSPGSVTEKLHFFVGEYTDDARAGEGGGNVAEGEDIEVMEVPIQQALMMIAEGEIADGKTIMLLQYAQLHLFGAGPN